MAKAEIMDLTLVCQSFPDISGPQIPRDNILNTMDDIFTGDTKLIMIEGSEGIGKTILLAQFSVRHPNHALSLFAKPTSRWTYDPEILRFDLCNQLHWVLYREELSEEDDIDDAFLRGHLLKLQKRARREQEAFYFVVDGLHDIPPGSTQIRKLILDMLPLGLPGFRFLLSGELDQFSKDISKEIHVKPFPLTPFILDETAKYMSDLNMDRQSVEEIHKTCQGIPGHLASVRRILQSGIEVQVLLEEMPSKLPNLFEIEWRKTKDDERVLKLLAILAHDRKIHSIDDLARVLRMETAVVRELLQYLNFVIIDPKNCEVSFVSEAFRRYAVTKLQHLKQEVYACLIDELLEHPSDRDALLYLPDYYEQAGRYEDLLNYLCPGNFADLLEHSQSLYPVQQKADLGINTAKELGRDGDLMRFSVQKSAMIELHGAGIWRSEIEARVAVNDYEAALALAQSAVLKEDRLHLLAIIAKAKRKQGLSPEPELMEQIRQLYDQIDITTLGEQATEIAADLICSNPNLAIELVEKATNTDVDENELDWAFAKLAIAALSAGREQTRPTDIIQSIRSRIRDPKLRSFSAAISVLLEEYSAAEVIAETEKIDSTSNRLYLLRLWAVENRKRDDAIEVVVFALKLAISTTAYASNAGVFRDIAIPLPFISDTIKAEQLVGSFDSQRNSIERIGPTEDYVGLQLLLAETESRYDFDAACNRLVDIYCYIRELDDLATKAECMSLLVALLPDMDPQLKLETREGIHSMAETELKSDVERLLVSTADHYHAVRGILRTLAKAKPDMAFEFALALNTEPRRDMALLDVVESVAEVPLSKVDLPFVMNSIDEIADPELRDEALLKVIERLSAEPQGLDSLIGETFPLVNRIKDIREADERCRACCLAYSFLIKQNSDDCSGLASHLIHQLSSAWQAIDTGWNKANVGFKIAESLATCSLENAKRYLDLAEEFTDNTMFDAHVTAFTYLACLQLAIRAYSGLLPKDIDTEADMERLTELIDRIPSSGGRARLWGELALHYYINGRSDDCRHVVVEHVKPLLQDLSPDDGGHRDAVITVTAPALYCAHKTTALEQFLELPQPRRDKAYERVCEFILRKQSPSDPYDGLPGQGYDVAYEEIVDICELLESVDQDRVIYRFVECIADSLVSRRLRNRFSQQQKSDIAARLERLIKDKLPNLRHIRHDGYKIAAQAQVARIRQAKPQAWVDLIDEARKIPNLADRALVLCIVATAMPRSQESKRKQAFEEARELIEQIPATLDKITRYEEIASMLLDIDPTMSKEYVKAAMQSAIESSNPRVYSAQRRIIDLAYKLDPDLAASLASLADDDPARKETRANLKRRLQILDLRRRMADQLTRGLDSALSKSDYASAAWMLLGSLNSGRAGTIHVSYTRDFIQLAASLSISQSYPILAWLIENAKRRHAKTDQAASYLRPMYEAMLLGAELSERMAARSSIQLKRTKRHAIESSPSGSVLIRAGDREYAKQYLRDWFVDKVRDYLKICDPFFGPDDLEVLQMICSTNPTCKVQVLTSRKHQNQQGIPLPWDDAYRNHWRVRISDQNPPNTEIIIVGTESGGTSPIHDRWWLTNEGGIRIGTSYNSLGVDKDSEISVLSKEQAGIFEREIDRYLQRIEQQHNGVRLSYMLFTL